MPHMAIIERGYKGKIYQTHAAATPDLVRIGGKDVEGAFVVSGPAVVAEQLPDNHPSKTVAVDFVTNYEKAYGPGTRNQFAGHSYDAKIVLEKILPVALKKAKPGTPEFRAALRDAVEGMGRTIFSHGVMNWTRHRPLGLHQRNRRDAEGRRRQVRRREVIRRSESVSSKAYSAQPGQGPLGPAADRIARPVDATIAGILALDGLTNGAIYALLALATVLVFAVTRVIFIPQGEFVAFGALTLALLQTGRVPGTVWFLLVLAAAVVLQDLVNGLRQRRPATRLLAQAARTLAWPVAVSLLAIWAAPKGLPMLAQAALTVALVTPFGALIYRLAYESLADASVLVLLIVSVGVHFALVGLGLVLLRRRGFPQPELLERALQRRGFDADGPGTDHLRRLARAHRRAVAVLREVAAPARRCAPPR